MFFFSQIIHPKSDEQRRRLSEAVSKIFLFGTLDQEQAAEVLDAMFEKKVQWSQVAIIIVTGTTLKNFSIFYDEILVMNPPPPSKKKKKKNYTLIIVDNKRSFHISPSLYLSPNCP
jgi:anthranilate phosphoribosyltransferase